MEKTINQQDSLKLEKAYTFFMVPFYFEKEFDLDEKWILESKPLTSKDGSYLYPYIMSFLQGQMEGIEKEHLSIYSLREDSIFYKKFWKRFASSNLITRIDEKTNEQISFFIPNSGTHGFFAPHIFTSSSANMGILTFCTSLAKENLTAEKLELFNFHIHKIDGQVKKCICTELKLKEGLKEDIQKHREKDICIAREFIKAHDIKRAQEWSPTQEFTWNINTLKDALLNVKTKDSVSLFTPPRIHLFTFCILDEANNSSISIKEVTAESIRLSKNVSRKYNVNLEEEEKHVLKTFENIFIASSIEATAMIAIAREENRGFINSMDAEPLSRYLWIYILAIIQRYTLLNIDRRINNLEIQNPHNNIRNQSEQNLKKAYNKKLWGLLKVISKVKTKCYYTDISPFSQHNNFYKHCCNNLHVISNYDEIDQKIQILDRTITHDIQELIQESESKAEMGQRRLNLVVGVLTAFQVSQVIYSFAKDSTISIFNNYCFLWAILTLALCFFLLHIVMNWENKNKPIIRVARKLYYMGNDPDLNE